MQSMTSNELRGNWATLLLAWNNDFTLDLNRVAAEIDVLVASSVDGIYSCGTAGEFHTLTETEFDEISGLLAAKCTAANLPFQIGASHMSSQISLERLRRSVGLAPSAIQIILPDWCAVTQSEAIAFLERMAEDSQGIGLVLYNPPHAKRVLLPVEIAALSSAIPGFIGVKTAGGDAAWYAAMREHIPHLSVFIPGHRLATGIREGASGAYSNAACLNPRAAQAWYQLMLEDIDAALEVEGRLRAFIEQHIVPFITEQGYCAAACDRLMAQIGDWADVGERMRWPYRAIPASESLRLRVVAREMVPEFIG